MDVLAPQHLRNGTRVLKPVIGGTLPDASLRESYEQLIRTRYEVVHGARLLQLMPNLLGCVGVDDRPLAVLGYQSAAHRPLFLEQYLDAPIEEVLRSRGESLGAIVRLERRRIVEVGNFASHDRSATMELLKQLPGVLVREGFEWLVFTGTPRVRELVASFGAPLLDLGVAEPQRLQRDADCWGRYYDSAPRVMAGWLGHCAQVAA